MEEGTDSVVSTGPDFSGSPLVQGGVVQATPIATPTYTSTDRDRRLMDELMEARETNTKFKKMLVSVLSFISSRYLYYPLIN